MFKEPKKILSALVLIILATGLVTGLMARVREGKVLRVLPGMSKAEVDKLLGAGRLDTSPSGCPDCSGEKTKYVYKGNPSVWFGHLDDALVVCYVEGVVCGTYRVSL